MREEQDFFEENGVDRKKVFHKGSVIYKEGQKSDVAYIIKEGKVGLHRVLGNKRVNLGVRGAGRIFGEMGVISGGKRSATAEAKDYTEVIVLDKKLLRTLLLKSPRPVQIVTGYLVERVKELNARITDRPTGNIFLSVCQILALCWKSAQTGGKKKIPLSHTEVSRTIKDIILISQLEIDEVLERLHKLAVIELTDVKGTRFRRDPLLGEKRVTSEYLKDRTIIIPNVEKFTRVSRTLSRELRDTQGFACDLEFIDIDDFASMAETRPEVLYKKIGYRQIPETYFFFHKPTVRDYIEAKGPEFFKRAKRPRLTDDDLETVEDIVGVDNTTLQEAFSRLGFYKVAVLAAVARDEAREKVYKNLSKKIAAVVREEAAAKPEPDADEAADVEAELIDLIKTMKGLGK